MEGKFFCYNANVLAIDPARPWQVLSHMGALCGKFATEDRARAAVDSLNADKEAGKLPTNLSEWERADLLE